MNASRRIFIIRAGREASHSQWIHEEMTKGLLRQGWGWEELRLLRDGELVDKEEWLAAHRKLDPNKSAEARWRILTRLLRIMPGDIVVVPHVPAKDQVTMAVVTGQYCFMPNAAGDIDGTHSHVVPIDHQSMRTVHKAESEAILKLMTDTSLIGKYRDAVTNDVVEEDVRRGILRLLSKGLEAIIFPRLQLVEAPAKQPGQPRLKRAFKASKRVDDNKSAAIGLAGEELVVRWEQERLAAAGRSDLAAKVRHVSIEDGDWAGYDVESFDLETGGKLQIEVKTTRGGQNTPFFISANEVAFAREHPATWRLYRVFDLNKAPKFHVLTVLDDNALEPTEYRYHG